MSEPELTKCQEAAFANIMEWVASDRDSMLLGGFAGTGKTWLMAHVVAAINGQCTLCAPTHSACNVLKNKINMPVKTVHSLVYMNPKDLEGGLIAKLLASEDKNERLDIMKQLDEMADSSSLTFSYRMDWNDEHSSLVICDEASMITAEMIDIFKDLGCRVLYVGDGAQLPPVNAQCPLDFNNPDAFLDEIVRTGKDNPITLMANTVRKINTNRIPILIKTAKQKMPDTFTASPVDGAKVIVWTNKRRRMVNEHMSEFGHKLVEGELYISRTSKPDLEVFSGQLLELISFTPVNTKRGKIIKGRFNAKLINKDTGLEFDAHINTADLDDSLTKVERKVAAAWGVQMSLPHAITAHMSQGSEYDHVWIIPDRVLSIPEGRKWFYTAITRARKTIFVQGSQFS